MRWRLLSGYELWLDNIFSGLREDWARLAADAGLVNSIRGLGLQRAVRSD